MGFRKELRLAKVDEIPQGEFRSIEIHGSVLIVANYQGNYCVFDGVCPHDGGSLQDGIFFKGTIECPRHHFKYDVCTGENIYPRNVYPKGLEYLQEQLRPLKLYSSYIKENQVLARVD